MIEYQRTEHLINDNKFSFSKTAPTNGDPTARVIEIVDKNGNASQVNLTHEGFALFKDVVNNY